MLIVCPSCQAEYNVPDALLGHHPRQVRCARCAMEWLPEELRGAPAADIEIPITAPAEVAATPEPYVAPAPPASPSVLDETRLPTTAGSGARAGGGIAPALAWLVSLAVLGAAGWSAIQWRDAIIQAWPASQRLYQWIGLG